MERWKETIIPREKKESIGGDMSIYLERLDTKVG